MLANIALSGLDDHFVEAWQAMGQTSAQRQWRRRQGLATYRLVRYADDWVLMVAGTRAHAEALRGEAAAVLAPMGLRLSEGKTRIAHIDEGFDFLGFRIQRHTKRGTAKRYVLNRQAPGGFLTNQQVLIVDEAGMVDTRRLARVVRQARATGAKVVLVGDHHQLPQWRLAVRSRRSYHATRAA